MKFFTTPISNVYIYIIYIYIIATLRTTTTEKLIWLLIPSYVVVMPGILSYVAIPKSNFKKSVDRNLVHQI